MSARVVRIALALAVALIVVVSPRPGHASPGGYTGGLSPVVLGGLADMDGSGVVGGRDDSNGFYGRTHVIDGALDCDAWDRPNAGTPGDRAIDGADDCTLVGVDGSDDGATILVEDGRFVSLDGGVMPEGIRLPALFDADDPTTLDVAGADLAAWVLDGRVDVNANGIVDEGDCARGVVGVTDDAGLGRPVDGIDVLGASATCAEPAAGGISVAGLVDVDGDGTITLEDTCRSACFVGMNVRSGFVRRPPEMPAVASFTPAEGAVGTSVTIEGSTLADATAVWFGETPAPVVSATETAVVTEVPEGATTARITVWTPHGAPATASSFTVVGTPSDDVHERTVTLALRRSLVAVGSVTVADGVSDCAVGVVVRIQRKVGQRWTTIQSARTTLNASYRAPIPDLSGKYRAILPNVDLRDGTTCASARSAVVTR